jgi:hypothetical protein
MSDGYIQHRLWGREPGCQFERTLRGEYCGEISEVRLDGLRLCERHAAQLRLGERVAYWRAILAHIRLWSGEARSRSRGDVVRLLEIERARAEAALERVSEDLLRSRDGEDVKVGGNGKAGSGDVRDPPPWWRPPLFVLSVLTSLASIAVPS